MRQNLLKIRILYKEDSGSLVVSLVNIKIDDNKRCWPIDTILAEPLPFQGCQTSRQPQGNVSEARGLQFSPTHQKSCSIREGKINEKKSCKIKKEIKQKMLRHSPSKKKFPSSNFTHSLAG